MVDLNLLLTVTLTLIIVPLISFIVSRFDSLPIDILGAGASIIVLFFDGAQKFSHAHGSNEVAPEYIFIVVLVGLIGMVLSVFIIGTFKSIQHHRATKSIKDGEYGTLYTEVGYCLSLFLSIVLLMYSISVTVAIPILLDKKFYASGQLFEIVDSFSKTYHPNNLFIALGIIYVIFLVMRYFRLLHDKIRTILDDIYIKPPHSSHKPTHQGGGQSQ